MPMSRSQEGLLACADRCVTGLEGRGETFHELLAFSLAMRGHAYANTCGLAAEAPTAALLGLARRDFLRAAEVTPHPSQRDQCEQLAQICMAKARQAALKALQQSR